MYALEADVSRTRDGRVSDSVGQSMAMVLLSTMLSLQEKHRDNQIVRWGKSQAQVSESSQLKGLKKTRSAKNLLSTEAAQNLKEGAAAPKKKIKKKPEVAEVASGGAMVSAGGEAPLFGLPSGIAAQDKLGNTALHIVLIQVSG